MRGRRRKEKKRGDEKKRKGEGNNEKEKILSGFHLSVKIMSRHTRVACHISEIGRAHV